MKFPEWWEAPDELFNIDGHCGLVAAWVVLRHFEKRISVPHLVKACRYTKRHGVFTVSLAAALKHMAFVFLFILSGTLISAATNAAVTLTPAASGSCLRLRSKFPRFLIDRSAEIFQLCCSILHLVMAIFPLYWGRTTELYDCRWQMEAECP